MTLPRADVDPDGLVEYSVVFTDRSLNHMSARFTAVMQELLEILRTTYRSDAVAVIPGGGTCAMEAVARQLATGKDTLVIRNGFFSYRWSQIFEAGSIASASTVCRAIPSSSAADAQWSPAPIDDVTSQIREKRPAIVCAPHVETASGIVISDDYLRAVASAVHEVGGLFVLDCIASGALWVDMADLGVDVLLSAPQKGWSGSPGAGYVMLSAAGRAAVESTTSTSFALDLRRWLEICDGYVSGTAAYHATMATDTIQHNLAQMRESVAIGLETLRAAQWELGTAVRELLAERGFSSVAAPDVAAPSVVVVHTTNPDLKSGALFKKVGLQVAAGVPLQTGEPADYATFRLGLFGLDKLTDVSGTVTRLREALDALDL